MVWHRLQRLCAHACRSSAFLRGSAGVVRLLIMNFVCDHVAWMLLQERNWRRVERRAHRSLNWIQREKYNTDHAMRMDDRNFIVNHVDGRPSPRSTLNASRRASAETGIAYFSPEQETVPRGSKGSSLDDWPTSIWIILMNP